MLRIVKLEKHYKNNVVLNISDFECQSSSIVGIVGPNGSGKSTMLKCIAQLISYNGDVIWNNQPINQNISVLKNFGVIIEEPFFMNSLTAYQNLDYYLDCVDDAIPYLKILDIDTVLHNKVKTYSLGMKQKLAFALACAKGKEIELLDEPFNSMDSMSIKKCIKILKKQKKDGRLIVVVSHDSAVLNKLCDEIYVINKGKLIKLEQEEREKRDYYLKFEKDSDKMEAIKRLCAYYELEDEGLVLKVNLEECESIQYLRNRLSQISYTVTDSNQI